MVKIMGRMGCYCPECSIHGYGNSYSNGTVKTIRDCNCGHVARYINMYLKAPFEEVKLKKRLKIPMRKGLPIYVEAGCTLIYQIMPDGSKMIKNVLISQRR